MNDFSFSLARKNGVQPGTSGMAAPGCRAVRNFRIASVPRFALISVMKAVPQTGITMRRADARAGVPSSRANFPVHGGRGAA